MNPQDAPVQMNDMTLHDKTEQVISHTHENHTSVVHGVGNQKTFYKKPLFIVLLLSLLILLLLSLFSFLNFGNFEKKVEFKKTPITKEQYQALLEQIKKDGFHSGYEIDSKLIEKRSQEDHANTDLVDPTPPKPVDRNKDSFESYNMSK